MPSSSTSSDPPSTPPAPPPPRQHGWLVVSLTGITGGGKSELCTYLYHQLPNTTRLLRQDDYFLPADSPRHVKCPGGIDHLNWDVINCIDMDRMFVDTMKILDNPPVHDEEKGNISYTNMVVKDGSSGVAKNVGVWTTKNSSSEAISEPTSAAVDASGISDVPGVSESLNDTEEVSVLQHPCLDSSLPEKHTSSSVKSSEEHSSLRPILLLDGFTLLDDPRFLALSDKVFFFELTKEECFRRREARCFDPPDVPGYFDHGVWSCYLDYRARCRGEYSERVGVTFLDGAGDQKSIHRDMLRIVETAAGIQ